jgi:hypothetical protein
MPGRNTHPQLKVHLWLQLQRDRKQVTSPRLCRPFVAGTTAPTLSSVGLSGPPVTLRVA